MKRAPEGSGQAMRARLSQNLSRILIGRHCTEHGRSEDSLPRESGTKLASSPDKSGHAM